MNDMEKNQIPEGSEDFAAMLEETMIKFRPGQIVKGVVAQVSDDGVVVSIPGKADGDIKKNDLVTADAKVGDEPAPAGGRGALPAGRCDGRRRRQKQLQYPKAL